MKKKIKRLNSAYRKIVDGIAIIHDVYRKNREISGLIYCIKKAHGNLNRKLLQLLKKEQLDKDWDRLVIKLKEKKDGK